MTGGFKPRLSILPARDGPVWRCCSLKNFGFVRNEKV
jgi:hypothetical protein